MWIRCSSGFLWAADRFSARHAVEQRLGLFDHPGQWPAHLCVEFDLRRVQKSAAAGGQ